MKRRDGLEHDRGRAVRVRDDALVPVEVLGVDLGNDERDFRVLAERAGVVDHLRTGLDDGVLELDRDVRLTREEDDVETVERVFVGLLDMIRLTEYLLVAFARRKHLYRPLEREVPLLEDLDHLGADGTDAHETY